VCPKCCTVPSGSRPDATEKDGHAPENLEDLVDLRVSGEERVSPHRHLSEDRSHGPHVNGGRVMPAAEEDFGCAIPQRHNLFVELASIEHY
jgi:hypothetical protein